MKVRLITLGAVLALAGVACGGDSTPDAGDTSSPPPATTNTVGVAGLQFTPATLNVAVGTKVTWSWTGSLPHNVVAEDGTFDSGEAVATDTLEHTFTTAGSFKYVCEVHKPGMAGTIVVA